MFNLLGLHLVTIFKNVLKDNAVSAFICALTAIENNNIEQFLTNYSNFISILYEQNCYQNFFEYIKSLIYSDENIISVNYNKEISNRILKTAEYELTLFDKLLDIDYNTLKSHTIEKFKDNAGILEHLPEFSTKNRQKFNLKDIIDSYTINGYGIFRDYRAFNLGADGEIIPIENYEAITFSQLKNYEYQKSVIYRNTELFLDGRQANNILLYGDRGCGKSSTVKSLINEFRNENLKIIQISKESFIYLPKLYNEIRNQPLKFIIFADDISFEETDKNFSTVKAALEGSLISRPRNSVIYATTNRFHLVKENFSAREGSEIHYNDTIDEMVSLSDRFAIILTFSVLTKNEYLDIVKKIAEDENIQISDNLLKKAEEFSALKGIRTPRTAKQFIIDYQH